MIVKETGERARETVGREGCDEHGFDVACFWDCCSELGEEGEDMLSRTAARSEYGLCARYSAWEWM
jgi:hypothetical protein